MAVITQQIHAPGTFGPFAIPDDEHTLIVQLSNWSNANRAVDMTVDISLDSGGTWTALASTTGCLPVPLRDGTTGASMSFAPLPLLCNQCGVYYLPGDARYERALSHCTVTLKEGVTILDVRQAMRDAGLTLQDVRQRILTIDGLDIDGRYLNRVFHTPTSTTPANRQVRVSVTGAAVNLTLTLTTGA